MPKVLRVINRLNLGGPTYNASYLTKYLAPEFETILVAGMKDESEASSSFIPQSMGIDAVPVLSMRRSIDPFKDIRAYNEIKKIIKDFKPDIVHTHAAKAGTLGRLAAFKLNVPVVIHTFHGHVFHSYFNRLKTGMFINIERYLAKRSTKIIAISRLQKKELLHDYRIAGDSKIEVIPLGFDLKRFTENMDMKRKKFREEYKIENGEIAVGIIGRVVPVKNHSMFLHVIREVSSRASKKIRFFIIGDGESMETVKNEASLLGIEWSSKTEGKSLLTFTSWIKQIDIADAGLDIVVLTSLNEGTPVSLIEAQAANRAVVATNVGGVEDVVIADKTALLNKPDDVKGFSDNLLKLIENDPLRNEMSKNGYEHVSEKFSYTRLVEDTRILYKKLLNI